MGRMRIESAASEKAKIPMPSDPRRILIIAYAYPPYGGAGVQRTAKFAKYLPEFNWTPTVLTVLPSCYGLVDPSSEKDVPQEIEVIRTPLFDPVARSGPRPAGPFTDKPPEKERTTANRGLPRQSILRKFLRWGWSFVDAFLLIPDRHILWLPRALIAGMELVRRNKFRLIYATGEPYSTYLVAYCLSRLTGVPFVLDMRDPWTIAPYRTERRLRLRRAIEKRQERRVLRAAKACVFANTTTLYEEAYPELEQKFHYVPNGYDPADFAGIAPKQFGQFTVVHSGTFLPGYRTADTFLNALHQLVTSRPDMRERLQVLFVGKVGDEQRLVEQLALGGIVKHTGYVSHSESIAYVKGADLLLLVGGRHSWE